MGFSGNQSFFQPHQSLADKSKSDDINVLKQSLEEGNIKIYEDDTRLHERIDIILDNQGVVKIYKDYHKDFATSIMKGVCKRIEVFSREDELVGSFALIPESQYVLNPVYRVQYGTTHIGNASGDVPMALGKLLLNPDSDVPLMSGSQIARELVDTIKKLLQGKTV